VGLWDALRGRTTPKAANLDALFALPSAAMTLEAALDLHATGAGSVCFRAAEGQASVLTQRDAADLIGADGGPPTTSRVDEYGYSWLTIRTDPPDMSGLVTDLHAVNTSLEQQGFGSGLLCSVVSFAGPAETRLFVVYLYKQGTFYPFAPTDAHRRDDLRERQIRDCVGADLPIEPDLGRWMPLWGIQD
jgi:hypothetical protein